MNDNHLGMSSADEVRAPRSRLCFGGLQTVEWWHEVGFLSTEFLDPDGHVVEVFWERTS